MRLGFRFCSFAVTVVLLLTACGSRVDLDSLQDASATPSADPSAAVSPDGPAPSQATPEPPKDESAPAGSTQAEGSEPAPAPDEQLPEDIGRPNDDPRAVPIHLTVEPSCVAVGEEVTVTIETVPRAELTYAVGYSDGRPHGQMGFARTDDQGVNVWRWTVAPDVPPGPATVLVQAVSEDGERGDSAVARFSVADAQGECG